MRTEAQESFISLIGAALRGERAAAVLSACDRGAVMECAKRHQMEHIAAFAFSEVGDPSYSSRLYSVIWMTEQQSHVLAQASAALSAAGIKHVPLKGAVLRPMYPAEWMRNSCDVDILVHENDLEQAEAALRGLGYEKDEDSKSAHDVIFHAGKVHLELHYTLIESYRFPEVSAVLETVWERLLPIDGCRYAMTDEMFYFYHVAHMLKHFENGGCGIRSFTDIWVLNHLTEFDRERRYALLREGGIETFALRSEELAEAWFTDFSLPHLDALESFVISGGAYGNTENSVAVKKSRKGGKLKYLFSRLFVPYSQLRKYYPVLNKHPYLLPVFEVVRWFSALKRGKTYARELSATMTGLGEDDSTRSLLSELGID